MLVRWRGTSSWCGTGLHGPPRVWWCTPVDFVSAADHHLPAIPASAGAMIFDRRGRLLLLCPTYKSGWTIPGGVMEASGETPWQACQREVFEECGLRVTTGRLACVDTRPAKPAKHKPMGLRFLFDCGQLPPLALACIRLQRIEISQYRFADPDEALLMLRPAVRRRVAAALSGPGTYYLEDGYPVEGVTGVSARPVPVTAEPDVTH